MKSKLNSLPRMAISDEIRKPETEHETARSHWEIEITNKIDMILLILASAASTTPSTVSSLLRG